MTTDRTARTLADLDSRIGILAAMRVEAVQRLRNAEREVLELDERIDEAMREQREIVERMERS